MAISSEKPWLFGDESKQTITSHERIQRLINNGFLFEACVVQAVVIEGMLFFLILMEASLKPLPESEKIRRGLSNLTMGQLINRARKHSMVDSGLLDQLDIIKDKRNVLVHHLLTGKIDFDYRSFITESEDLISALFERGREKTYQRLKDMDHPLGEEFTEKLK